MIAALRMGKNNQITGWVIAEDLKALSVKSGRIGQFKLAEALMNIDKDKVVLKEGQYDLKMTDGTHYKLLTEDERICTPSKLVKTDS